MENPKVFISYSWDNQEHKDWVTALTNKLRKDGIDAKTDSFILQKETVNMNRMMIESIRDNDYILLILTDRYKEKSELFLGGVGYETSLLINQIKDNPQKIIPIIRFKGDKSEAIPFYLKGLTYIDLTNESEFDEKYEDLKYKIYKKDKIEIESLGPIPELKSRKVTMDDINKSDDSKDDLIPNFRVITDKDKSEFMKKSYIEIIEKLSDLSEKAKVHNYNFDYEIDKVTNKKTIIKFYIDGMQKKSIKIWLGSMFSKEENIMISYDDSNISGDNSWNEMIVCEIDDNKDLNLKMNMNFYGNIKTRDSSKVAEKLWKFIVKYLK